MYIGTYSYICILLGDFLPCENPVFTLFWEKGRRGKNKAAFIGAFSAAISGDDLSKTIHPCPRRDLICDDGSFHIHTLSKNKRPITRFTFVSIFFIQAFVGTVIISKHMSVLREKGCVDFKFIKYRWFFCAVYE